MLDFLKNPTRPEAQFVVHQCAQFSANPKLPHDQAVKSVLKYLKGTATQRLVMKPYLEKVIEFYVDSVFVEGCNQEEVKYPGSVLYIMGYLIRYSDCPIRWASRLQTYIALSTTEA